MVGIVHYDGLICMLQRIWVFCVAARVDKQECATPDGLAHGGIFC